MAIGAITVYQPAISPTKVCRIGRNRSTQVKCVRNQKRKTKAPSFQRAPRQKDGLAFRPGLVIYISFYTPSGIFVPSGMVSLK